MCGTLFTTRMETRTFTLCFMIQIFGVMLERVKVMQYDRVPGKSYLCRAGLSHSCDNIGQMDKEFNLVS